MDQGLSFYDKYVDGLALPDWKVITDDKKAGLTIWQRNQGGLKAMKAEAIIDSTADEIFKVIGDPTQRKDYDETYDDGWALEKIAHQTFI